MTGAGRRVRPPVPALSLLAVLTGAAVGAAVAVRPDLFHLVEAPGPATTLVLLAGLAAAVWLAASPGAAVVVAILLVYLNLSEILVRFHGLPSVLQLLAPSLVVGAWVAIGRRRLGELVGTPLPWAAAALPLLWALSSLWALETGPALARAVEGSKGLAIFLVIGCLASSRRRIQRAVIAAVAAGTLLAGLGIVQVLTEGYGREFGGLARIKHAQIYADVFEPRIAGPLGDPNYFAQILLVLVPIVLLAAWRAPRRWQRWAGNLSALLLMAATVLTYSRGGALVLAGVVVLTVLVRGLDWREIAALLVVGMLALPLLPDSFLERMTTLEQILPGEDEVLHLDSSFEKRKLVTATAWRMFADHPVIGVGAGNYAVRFTPYADEVGSDAREYEDPFATQYPHNLYLEIGAETGVVGLGVFAMLVAAAFLALEDAVRRLGAEGAERLVAIGRGLEISLVGYLATGLLLHGQFQRYFWLFLGLALALQIAARSPDEPCPA